MMLYIRRVSDKSKFAGEHNMKLVDYTEKINSHGEYFEI